MATIESSIGSWSAEADIPSDDEGLWYLRYQVALAGIALEREALRVAHRADLGEDPEIEDSEYATRTAILDDLERQFRELFEESVPEIQWSED